MPYAARVSTLAVIFGFVILWLVLDRSAALLSSLFGEWGLVICAAVIVAAVVTEIVLTGRTPVQAAAALGLRRPRGAVWLQTILIVALLLLYFPLFSLLTGTTIRIRPDALLLLPGLFAQGGIAEELVFRGFLFRHLRENRTFWRAALLSAVPFTAVHLLLFSTLEPVLAVLSIAIALSMSFPLAWLFERSGNSVWSPALVHFVAQGAVKLAGTDGDRFLIMAMGWMVLSALIPWLAFLIRDGKTIAVADMDSRP